MNEQDIKTAYHNLPELVREIIDGSEWEQSIRRITNKYKLLINQGLALEDETLLVMLGLSRPESFVENLVQNAEIEPTVATEISHEIEDTIFTKIREAIQEETENEVDIDQILEPTPISEMPPAPTYNERMGAPNVKQSAPVPTPAPEIKAPAPVTAPKNEFTPAPAQATPAPAEKPQPTVPVKPVPAEPDPEPAPQFTPKQTEPTTETDFISRKLSDTTVTKKIDSDQSFTKPTGEKGEIHNETQSSEPAEKKSYPGGIDPYREPVE